MKCLSQIPKSFKATVGVAAIATLLAISPSPLQAGAKKFVTEEDIRSDEDDESLFFSQLQNFLDGKPYSKKSLSALEVKNPGFARPEYEVGPQDSVDGRISFPGGKYGSGDFGVGDPGGPGIGRRDRNPSDYADALGLRNDGLGGKRNPGGQGGTISSPDTYFADRDKAFREGLANFVDGRAASFVVSDKFKVAELIFDVLEPNAKSDHDGVTAEHHGDFISVRYHDDDASEFVEYQINLDGSETKKTTVFHGDGSTTVWVTETTKDGVTTESVEETEEAPILPVSEKETLPNPDDPTFDPEEAAKIRAWIDSITGIDRDKGGSRSNPGPDSNPVPKGTIDIDIGSHIVGEDDTINWGELGPPPKQSEFDPESNDMGDFPIGRPSNPNL